MSCFEVFANNVSASMQVFLFLRPPCIRQPFPKIGARVCGGGPFQRDGASQLCRFFAPKCRLFPSHLLVVLCAVRWRESSVCAFRSSCRFCGSRYIFLCGAPFPSRVCNCNHNRIQKWSLFLQNRIHSWKIHHACPLDAKSFFTRCFFTLWTRYLCTEDVFLPIAHRLSSLPPSMLCFQTCSQVCELISNRNFPRRQCAPVPIVCEKLQLCLRHSPRVTEQEYASALFSLATNFSSMSSLT